MDTTTPDLPAMELTRNVVDDSWGFICREHGLHRAGLSERHARNVEAKHLREDHAFVVNMVQVNLTYLAQALGADLTPSRQAIIWATMTGQGTREALSHLRACQDAQEPVLAYVPAF